MAASTELSPLPASYAHTRSSPLFSSPAKIPAASPSSSKRMLDEAQSLSPKRQKFDHRHRTTLWSYPQKTSVRTCNTHEMQKTAAILEAKKIDRENNYNGKQTEIQAVDDLPSSQSEVFAHRNYDQWQSEALADAGRRATLATALCCLYDSFFHHLGYRPKWDPWVKAMEPVVKHNPRFNTRSECVENHQALLRLHGIDDSALRYLNGDKSYYQTNQHDLHEMVVRGVGAALKQLTAKSSVKRTKAYLLAWTMVTGHESFEDGMNDRRLMGSEGVQVDNFIPREMSDDEEDEEDINPNEGVVALGGVRGGWAAEEKDLDL